MVIGIGNFKEINNTLGHTIGDSLSIELTNRLVTLVKDAFILSRTDTDEFALLIKSSLLIVDIKKIAQEIINVLRKPVYVNNSVLYVNTSIGISCFPDNEIDAEMLVRYAGIAMNEAKELIETKICFYSRQMSKEREKRFLISNHLASAIEHKELFLCYQPIFSMNEALTIIGLEALLRWNSAALGNVSPDKFIPLSESTGQIIEIGEWVFRQVCIQIDLWNKSHLELLPVSVNISVKQLEQIDFTQKIINIMKAHDIRASLIELEITESVSSGNLKVIIHNIKVLKKYGIKFSMDDFGTGFSSLGQLDVFELDKIKIDKIFIHDLIDDKKRQRLVKSIISMAESLNLAIVAEGIETQEQLDCLKKFGCQLGQGYLISKPLHPEEIQSYLKICDD
jgi:diguanylate cyclase (GGDEF)-like protein